jgi:hypothetical protein
VLTHLAEGLNLTPLLQIKMEKHNLTLNYFGANLTDQSSITKLAQVKKETKHKLQKQGNLL